MRFLSIKLALVAIVLGGIDAIPATSQELNITPTCAPAGSTVTVTNAPRTVNAARLAKLPAKISSRTSTGFKLQVPLKAKQGFVDLNFYNKADAIIASRPLRVGCATTLRTRSNKRSAITKTIGPDGGVLILRGADRVTYSLSIPAGALSNNTPITLTPITAIAGLSFSKRIVPGIIFEPKGLSLTAPATLEVIVSTAIDGAAAALIIPPQNSFDVAPVATSGRKISVSLSKLYGVVFGTPVADDFGQVVNPLLGGEKELSERQILSLLSARNTWSQLYPEICSSQRHGDICRRIDARIASSLGIVNMSGTLDDDSQVVSPDYNAPTFYSLFLSASFTAHKRIVDLSGASHPLTISFWKVGEREWSAQAYLSGEDVGEEAGKPVKLGEPVPLLFDSSGSRQGDIPEFDVVATPIWANGAQSVPVYLSYKDIFVYQSVPSIVATRSVAISGNLWSSQFSVIPGGSPTFAQLESSSDYNSSAIVSDSIGLVHTIRLYFWRTSSHRWQMRAYVDAGEVGGPAGAPLQVGGTALLEFEPSGERVSPLPAFDIRATPAWSNGAQALDIDLLASDVVEGPPYSTITAKAPISIQLTGELAASPPGGEIPDTAQSFKELFESSSTWVELTVRDSFGISRFATIFFWAIDNDSWKARIYTDKWDTITPAGQPIQLGSEIVIQRDSVNPNYVIEGIPKWMAGATIRKLRVDFSQLNLTGSTSRILYSRIGYN